MKKLLLLLLSVAILVACKPDEPTPFRLDPTAMISIKPDKAAFQSNSLLRSADVHLSALEIVKQTTCMRWMNVPVFGTGDAYRGFPDVQRDTSASNPCLKMWATDIIDIEGNLVPDFIRGYDVILEHWATASSLSHRDTIGYIPNSVIRAAEDSINIALAGNDIEAVYRIFNNAFTFRPITGAEWIALKMQGLQ